MDRARTPNATSRRDDVAVQRRGRPCRAQPLRQRPCSPSGSVASQPGRPQSGSARPRSARARTAQDRLGSRPSARVACPASPRRHGSRTSRCRAGRARPESSARTCEPPHGAARDG
ncbi:hypothetical protein ACFPRL_27670 [Pseudoclavibacter helvolus]